MRFSDRLPAGDSAVPFIVQYNPRILVLRLRSKAKDYAVISRERIQNPGVRIQNEKTTAKDVQDLLIWQAAYS